VKDDFNSGKITPNILSGMHQGEPMSEVLKAIRSQHEREKQAQKDKFKNQIKRTIGTTTLQKKDTMTLIQDNGTLTHKSNEE
jgi:hypothetical protein